MDMCGGGRLSVSAEMDMYGEVRYVFELRWICMGEVS